jgi:hypothetical protein
MVHSSLLKICLHLVYLLYANDGRGDMQFANLGAKGIVLRPMGDVNHRKKGVVNLNSNDEFKEFLLCGVRWPRKGKLENVL